MPTRALGMLRQDATATQNTPPEAATTSSLSAMAAWYHVNVDVDRTLADGVDLPPSPPTTRVGMPGTARTVAAAHEHAQALK